MTLKEGKTVIFSSPLDNNGEIKLVRTGSSLEDNLFHSTLYCTSRKFIRRNEKERSQMIKDLKDKIGSIVNFEFLRNFYRDIDDNNSNKYKFIKNETDYEGYKIFCEMFPYKKLLSTIKIQSLEACKIYCKNGIVRLKVDEEHKKFLIQKMNTLLLEDADIFFTKLSQLLEINIYILEKSSLLEKFYGRGKRKSIVLFNDDNNYQPVGVLLKDNRVNREFNHDDKLIRMLYMLHNDRDKVKKKYPFLLKREKDQRDQREESSSSSEEDNSRRDSEDEEHNSEEDDDSSHTDHEDSEHTEDEDNNSYKDASPSLSSKDNKIFQNFIQN